MKILITAFEPFDDNDDNFSRLVLKHIKEDVKIIKKTIPVLYIDAFLKVKELIVEKNPEVVILMGEARTYNSLGFEVIGINEFSKTPDNNHYIPEDRYIINEGLDGIFSTLNYDLFEKIFSANKTSFHRSFSAGTYVCNSTLYLTLDYVKRNNLDIDVGFIHIPTLNENEIQDISESITEYAKKYSRI